MQLDTKTIKLIQNQLRQASVMWYVREEVMKEAKVRVKAGFHKNGKEKTRVKFRCACCGTLWNRDQVEVDHILEVSHNTKSPSKMSKEDLFQWIENLFCDKSNLQVLSIGCHQAKTRNYNRSRSGKKMKKGRISLI